MKSGERNAGTKTFLVVVMMTAFSAIMLASGGCGGGGGGTTLPYLPQSALNDCSNGRGSTRDAYATGTSYSAIQCVQIHEYGAARPVPKGSQASVASGGSASFQAVLYDYNCTDITNGFATTSFTWTASPSLGTLTAYGAMATLSAATTTGYISGSITVSVYEGTTLVKQDTITVVVGGAAPSAGTLFAKTYGNSNDEFGLDMVIAPDGGFAMVGDYYPSSSGTTDFAAAKADASGNLVWMKYYDNPLQYGELQSIVNASDGGYILGGFSLDTWLNPTQAYADVIKIDTSGNEVWRKTYTGNGTGHLYRIVKEPAGGGGYAFVGGTSGSPWLAKIDSAGNIVWSNAFTSYTNCGSFSALGTTSDNGYIMAGNCMSNMVIAKTDSSGAEVWHSYQPYTSTTSSDIVYSAFQLDNGSYIVAGATEAGSSQNSQCLVISLSSSGTVQWSKTYGRSGIPEQCTAGFQSSQKLVLGGFSEDYTSGPIGDMWVFTTDLSGNFLAESFYGSGDSSLQMLWALAPTQDGNLAALGSVTPPAPTLADFLLVKMKPPGTP